MALFRRSSEEKKDNPEYEEIFEFPFEVLWQDEQPSNFLQYLPHIVQIVLLIWILIKK